MSFVNRKIRVFDHGSYDSDTEVQQRRSEGRLKTYQSATDVRSWGTTREDRRRHILDVVNQENVKDMKIERPVSVSDTIGTLLGVKKSSIKRLEGKIEEITQLLQEKIMKVTWPDDDGRNVVLDPGKFFHVPGDAEKRKKELQSEMIKNKNVETVSREIQTDLFLDLHTLKCISKRQIHLLKEILDVDSFMADYSTYKHKFENLKRVEECDQLKGKIRTLEREKKILLVKIHECDCCMQNQKKKIKRLLDHIDYITKSQYKRYQTQRPLPTIATETQQMISESSSINIHRISFYKDNTSERSPGWVHSIKESIGSLKQIQEANPDAKPEGCARVSRELLQNIGDNLKTKLELEKQKCNEIVNKYMNVVTNMRLEIEVIKKANSENAKKSGRIVNDTLKDIFKGDLICPDSNQNETSDNIT